VHVGFVPRRFDKFLRDSTPLSLVEGRAAIADGRATLSAGGAGERRVAPDELVFPDDVVRLERTVVEPRARQDHAILNKPRSVTSSVRDPKGKADLSRWLRQMPPGVFPVGRLDRDTTGLMLFTSDGDLANAVLQPGHHTDKRYWLWLDEPVGDDDPRLLRLRQGTRVDAARLGAKAARVVHRSEHFTELEVTLDEGRNRQIRKLCNALDFRLVQLHRRSVGPLGVDDLPVGAWRALEASEVEALWAATGGRERVRALKVRALERLAQRLREAGTPHQRLEAWLETDRRSLSEA